MQRKGFTLIELLVVISIIALLMSIMMPALSRVKEEALKISCMSRLRQWAVPVQMYTSENNGKFSDATSSAISGGQNFGAYQIIYRDFWQENPEVLICPEATKTLEEGVTDYGCVLNLNPTVRDEYTSIHKDFYHSYGYNNFCYNPSHGGNMLKGKVWRTIEQRSPEEIPIYGCNRQQAAKPQAGDAPPDYSGQPSSGNWADEMRRYCVDRHNKKINLLFLDFTVRTVTLKQLWRLKWHKGYEAQDLIRIDWPDWMKQISNSVD